MKASARKGFLLIGIVVLLIVVYFLPIPVSQTDEVVIHAPFEKTWGQISSLQRWKGWWPDTAGIFIKGDTVFHSPAVEYQLRNKRALQLALVQQNQSVYHILTVIPEGNNTSCILQWKKISYLRTAVFDKIRALFGNLLYAPAQLLRQVKESMEDPVKYYGFPISVVPVEDTFVLVKGGYAVKAGLQSRLLELYTSLQQYLDSIRYTGRAEKMFHVDSLGGDSVQVMAGLSLAKPVKAVPPFRLMTMPRAHIVVGEYEGNYQEIYRVHQAMSNYMKDHNIMPVAMVYEKMLSEPRTAQDSLHVKVRVYHPPMIP